jgi:long-chain acyl-CoA synthetase
MSAGTDWVQHWAQVQPDAIALEIAGTTEALTWRELEEGSRRCAYRLLKSGLRTGDTIAVYLDNHLRYFEILLGARRCGLYYTTVSRHLKAQEIAHVLRDCEAKAIFSQTGLSTSLEEVSMQVPGLIQVQLAGPPTKGWTAYDDFVAAAPSTCSLPPGPEGTDFCYSSGTTGLPKGIRRPLEQSNTHFVAAPDARMHWKTFDHHTVYLSTAPFYHTAPVRWNMAVLQKGGKSVLMQRFDPLEALRMIERYKITHSQWVPTMFIRMLRLPEAQRAGFDLSSHRIAVHAAAPCPVWVKRAMIDWWGPILYEYYSGTELVGRTSLSSQEWLVHPGSVGLPEFGKVHILDDTGHSCPTGTPGVIWFEGGPRFEYWRDPEKTQQAYNAQGWATYGDIGYLDADGFLYLTDRKAHMIISGGVNIYPQETEACLLQHPDVADVAVIGVPDPEFGEAVKAVVQLRSHASPSDACAQALIEFCRAHLSVIKCPRTVDFMDSLPRTETGKLLKREIKLRYATAAHQP